MVPPLVLPEQIRMCCPGSESKAKPQQVANCLQDFQ